MADLLGTLLRALTIAVIVPVGWLVPVIVGVLPSRDPGSIGTWSAAAVGAACLAATALLWATSRRPILWPLAAGGEAGVARAREILRTEVIVAMKLLGAPTLADLRRSHIAPGPGRSSG